MIMFTVGIILVAVGVVAAFSLSKLFSGAPPKEPKPPHENANSYDVAVYEIELADYHRRLERYTDGFSLSPKVSYVIGAVVVLIGLTVTLFSTALYIESDEGGIVVKKFGDSLAANQIIATNGEKGPESTVLSPGWHFLYWPWMYELTSHKNMIVPAGHVGVVTAMDGKPLPEGEVFAPEWEDAQEMLDADAFLKSGNGFRGPQLTVLSPGQYRYNNRLFKIDLRPALKVPVGKVAVIKANAGKAHEVKDGEKNEVVNGIQMVPKGHRGIWNKALEPNMYYMHPDAYVVTQVDVTNRVFNYVNSSTKKNHRAIPVRTKDGFEFPVDVRVAIEVSAENAPFVVAMLANPDSDNNQDGITTVEDKVVLPLIRSIFRNTAESQEALQYMEQRSVIEKEATENFRKGLEPYKITSDGVYVADIGLGDTEQGKKLLETQTDKEIAVKEQETWAEKTKAEVARAEQVKAQTAADKEAELVAAETKAKAAEDEKEAAILKAEGEAEAYKQKVQALGGEENFIKLEVLKMIVDAASNIKLPENFTYVGGNEGSGIDEVLKLGMYNQIKEVKKSESK